MGTALQQSDGDWCWVGRNASTGWCSRIMCIENHWGAISFEWRFFIRDPSPTGMRQIASRQISDPGGELVPQFHQRPGVAVVARGVSHRRGCQLYHGALFELLFGVELLDGGADGETPHWRGVFF